MKHDQQLYEAARDLVLKETRYLNAQDLDNWIKLYTEDGYYWMPLEVQHQNPEVHDSLIYDNTDLMQMRKHNLGNPLSPSMQLPVKSVRILSELEISDAEDNDTDIIATAAVIAFIYHKQQDSFAGTVTYRLRTLEHNLKIYYKRVDLINADAPLDNIMFYI
jgi:3-phenylpropionate/cinnamic acid dioxygenase small subunit